MDAREAHDHVDPEPIERIVGPRGGDRLERKVFPLRKLCGEQASNQTGVRG
jgi:hypothetical protein